ncbi:MAG: carbon-nitrogen hydrolase family protein [Acidilobaceae archaeon]
MVFVRLALVQFGALRDKSGSLGVIERLLDGYGGRPDLIVFPEYSMFDPTGFGSDFVWDGAEDLSGGWVGFFRDLASTRGSCVVATMFERSSVPPRVYNTAIVIDRSGDIIGVYRKTHLFDILGYSESSIITAGGELFKPVSACNLKIGLAICFELRYPEVFRVQALRGAEAVVVPAAWYRGPLKEETLRVLAQARAHENNTYIIVAAQYGGNFTGRSMVVDPYGVVIVDAGIGEKIIEAVIDTEEVYRAREKMPLHRLARWDLLLDSISELIKK